MDSDRGGETKFRAMQIRTGPELTTVGLLSPQLPGPTALPGKTRHIQRSRDPIGPARPNPSWAKVMPARQQSWEPGGRAWAPGGSAT